MIACRGNQGPSPQYIHHLDQLGTNLLFVGVIYSHSTDALSELSWRESTISPAFTVFKGYANSLQHEVNGTLR